MKTPRVILSAVALLTLSVAGFAQPTANLAGRWEGILHLPNRDLAVAVDLAQNAQGAWSGALCLSGASSTGVSLTELRVGATTLSFGARWVGAPMFAGTFAVTGEITGEWTQDGEKFPLRFKRSASLEKKPANVSGQTPPRQKALPSNFPPPRQTFPLVLIRLFLPPAVSSHISA